MVLVLTGMETIRKYVKHSSPELIVLTWTGRDTISKYVKQSSLKEISRIIGHLRHAFSHV